MAGSRLLLNRPGRRKEDYSSEDIKRKKKSVEEEEKDGKEMKVLFI